MLPNPSSKTPARSTLRLNQTTIIGHVVPVTFVVARPTVTAQTSKNGEVLHTDGGGGGGVRRGVAIFYGAECAYARDHATCTVNTFRKLMVSKSVSALSR